MLLIQFGAEKDREREGELENFDTYKKHQEGHIEKEQNKKEIQVYALLFVNVFHGILWRREPNSVRFFVDSLLFPTLGGEGFNKGLWSVDNYGPIKNILKRFGSVRVKGFSLKPRPSMQGLQVKNLRGHSSTQKSGLDGN